MANEGVIGARMADFDKLRTAIEEECAKIVQKQGVLGESIKRLNAMWEGQAHATFEADYQKNLTQLQQIADQVREVTVFEGNALTEYGSAQMDAFQAIEVL